MLRTQVRTAVERAVVDRFGLPTVPDFVVETPESLAHGDYATNVALVLAKSMGKKPMEVAESLVEVLGQSESMFTVRVAAPGFINFSLADPYLLSKLRVILADPAVGGASQVGEGKTVIVEYFQLNIAKRPHIGHLRSAVIGDAIKRLLLSQGYRVISDTHVGDWGTQFGILLLGYKESRVQGKEIRADQDPFDALEQLYVEENARIEKDPERRERAKEEFAKLERGDPENRTIWQWMVEVSMTKLEESAVRLGLLPFEEHRGESAYEEAIPRITAFALEKGVAKRGPDGAVIVDLSSEGLDEAVLIKSDGASTYLLRDLATIKYRKEHWKFYQNLYVVDVRQSHHFRQLFRVAELLGLEGVGESEQIEFGFMTSPEGALSSRRGSAISLDAVLDEARARALAVIQEKNPELADKERIAEMVGLGALKYFDLSHHRRSDIVFRWDDALSFEGNTGPYLQYTHARLKSILRKSGTVRASGEPALLTSLEHHLLVSTLRFPEVIADALTDFTPHTLANYLYQLAQAANEFYHSHPVLQEEDVARQTLRLHLVEGISLILSRGLHLLGIAAPEAM